MGEERDIITVREKTEFIAVVVLTNTHAVQACTEALNLPNRHFLFKNILFYAISPFTV